MPTVREFYTLKIIRRRKYVNIRQCIYNSDIKSITTRPLHTSSLNGVVHFFFQTVSVYERYIKFRNSLTPDWLYSLLCNFNLKLLGNYL